MKTAIVILILLFPLRSFAFDSWTKGDIAREATWQVLHLVDWGQTLDISAQPSRYHEINPILGKHPSRSTVNIYMASGALLHLGISHVLPQSYRPYWQYVTIGTSGACVVNNFAIGLSIKF